MYEYKRGRQSFCLEAQKGFQREETYFPTILSAQFILYITIYSNGLTWQILCHIHFFLIGAGFRKGRGTRSNCQHPLDHQKSKTVPEKHLLLLYWLCQSLWPCGSPQAVENSSRDGNTRPLDLSPEKSVCRSRSNS